MPEKGTAFSTKQTIKWSQPKNLIKS